MMTHIAMGLVSITISYGNTWLLLVEINTMEKLPILLLILFWAIATIRILEAKG